ncbi:MAG: hypothetical protein ACJ8AI_10240 [Rhodopila sp.]
MSGAELIRYDAMCQAIAAAYEVDEVKDIRDKARAIEVYARQARNIEAERRACEIRLRAERRCGQLLAEREKARGVLKQGDTLPQSQPATTGPETLSDLGISKTQSSRWQKLAAIPDQEFEATFSQPGKPTTNGLITTHAPKAAPEPPVTPVDPRALWLWGRLLDFERDGVLDADPRALFSSMLDHMKHTTAELAPRVAAWLGRFGP